MLQQNIGTMGDIAGQFGQFAQGEDPLLAAQRGRAMESVRGQMARQGLGGSSVAMNELGRVESGFDELGLSRRDAALQAQAGMLGGQGQMLGEFGQNLLVDPTLKIAMKAAKKSGSDDGGAK
jgi:hypothetical protein